MITKFYATREIARRIAREECETFADLGKDAPKGERWAVQFKEIKDVIAAIDANAMNVPTKAEQEVTAELAKAFAALDIEPAKKVSCPLAIPVAVCRREASELKNHKGHTVQVLTKRRILV